MNYSQHKYVVSIGLGKFQSNDHMEWMAYCPKIASGGDWVYARYSLRRSGACETIAHYKTDDVYDLPVWPENPYKLKTVVPPVLHEVAEHYQSWVEVTREELFLLIDSFFRYVIND